MKRLLNYIYFIAYSILYIIHKILNKLPDISKWETNNVENISYLFHNCSKLSFMPDISKWNLNNIKSFEYPFLGCSFLNELSYLNFNLNLIKNKDDLNKLLASTDNENESSYSNILQTIPQSQNSILAQSNQGNSQPEELQIQNKNYTDDSLYND